MVLAGSHAQPEERLRFLAEAEAVARLSHPNIVQVFEAGQHDGLPFFTMELVAGGSLSAYLGGTPLPPADAAALVEPLARAMHYAHQRGVVHRDLKPANVLLSEPRPSGSGEAKPLPDGRGSDFTPKIADFGLAKRVEGCAGLTRTGAVLGTPSYMSPEQARGQPEEVGPHSDTWALGAILYECLTGRPPFQGTTPADTLLQVIHEEPVPPTRLQPKVPRDLETIALTCLQKEPRRRYASAEALADDLRRFLAGEPIRARPVGPLGRGLRWCRRNPVVAGLAALTGAVFLVGFALVAAQWRRADGQWRRAEENFTAAEAQRQLAEANERRADDERKRAEEEARIAYAVQRFLQFDVLRQADPLMLAESSRLAWGGVELRPNPTVKELLDRAAAGLTKDKIDSAFPGQPRVQAEILSTIGRTYLGVGEYDKAVAHLARARDLTAHAFGPSHRDALTRSHVLALAMRRAGKREQAIALFEQVRAGRAAALGPTHPDTLTTAHNLAAAYRDAGKTPEAIALFKEVAAARSAELGRTHRDTVSTLNGLAGAYRDANRTPEAIALFKEALAARSAQLGRAHPETLATANNLAAAYWWDGKLDRSVQLFEQTLRLTEAADGPDHPETLVTMANLAVNYRDAGDRARGVALLDDAWRRTRKRPGRVPPQLEWLPRELAATYDRDRQFGRSEPYYRELVQLARKKYGAGRLELVRPLNRLGLNLIRQRKATDAERALRESLDIADNAAPASWIVFETKALLGGALLGQERYADAEPLLLAGYRGMKALASKVPAEYHAWLRESLGWLIELAEARQDKGAAAKWRKEREAMRK
jgi:tetratricopeptide (TPR) repeat protein